MMLSAAHFDINSLRAPLDSNGGLRNFLLSCLGFLPDVVILYSILLDDDD